jgi:hypothetical protein
MFQDAPFDGVTTTAPATAHDNDLEGDFADLVTDIFETDRRINDSRHRVLEERTAEIEARLASISAQHQEPRH